MQSIADEIEAELPPHLIPEASARELFLMYALLATVRGVDVGAEHVHDAWTAWMSLRGETHSSMVPFDELSSETQKEDEPYVAAIRRVASRHS